MEQAKSPKKQSVLNQIMFIFAIAILFVFAITATGSYFYSKNLIQRRSRRLAIIASKMVEELVNNVSIEKLQESSKTTIYKESRKTLRMICRNFGLEYLYVFAMNKEINKKI